MCFVAQTITQFTSWSRSMCRKSSLYLRLAEKLDGNSKIWVTQIERLRLLQKILPLPLVVIIKVSVNANQFCLTDIFKDTLTCFVKSLPPLHT